MGLIRRFKVWNSRRKSWYSCLTCGRKFSSEYETKEYEAHKLRPCRSDRNLAGARGHQTFTCGTCPEEVCDHYRTKGCDKCCRLPHKPEDATDKFKDDKWQKHREGHSKRLKTYSKAERRTWRRYRWWKCRCGAKNTKFRCWVCNGRRDSPKAKWLNEWTAPGPRRN